MSKEVHSNQQAASPPNLWWKSLAPSMFRNKQHIHGEAVEPISWKNRCKSALSTIKQHAKLHAGAGVVCAVAYFDPGNWGVDLLAGSTFGYKMLFVVALAGFAAIYLQVLASRLGCVTGRDLASHCRLLLYARPKHKLLYRYVVFFPLYVMAEVAIIATDLAELLGSAIALCLLFPALQMWHGVLITSFDVILLLALKDPLSGRPARMFEGLVAILVLAVLICICIVVSKVDVHWPQAFQGFLPSKEIVKADGLYTAVGILGATCMPHSIFLGSSLATQDRLSTKPRTVELPTAISEQSRSMPRWSFNVMEFLASIFRPPPKQLHETPKQNNSLQFVQAHLYHATVDVCGSLLGFAIAINSLILILAGAVFFQDGEQHAAASLFDAYDVIKRLVGSGAATLFAIALLAAGQSSSIIATVAGQAVSQGFLNWRLSPVMRRLLTRLLAVIPSMLVAISVGRSGIDSLLVISQVILSIVLPFITLPLIILTSNKTVMSVMDENTPEGPTVDFSNNLYATIFGGGLWLLVLVANMYLVVTLAIGSN